MNVKELRERLKNVNDDTKVLIEYDNWAEVEIYEVCKITSKEEIYLLIK